MTITTALGLASPCCLAAFTAGTAPTHRPAPPQLSPGRAHGDVRQPRHGLCSAWSKGATPGRAHPVDRYGGDSGSRSSPGRADRFVPGTYTITGREDGRRGRVLVMPVRLRPTGAFQGGPHLIVTSASDDAIRDGSRSRPASGPNPRTRAGVKATGMFTATRRQMNCEQVELVGPPGSRWARSPTMAAQLFTAACRAGPGSAGQPHRDGDSSEVDADTGRGRGGARPAGHPARAR
jgi:hypothetical protein